MGLVLKNRAIRIARDGRVTRDIRDLRGRVADLPSGHVDDITRRIVEDILCRVGNRAILGRVGDAALIPSREDIVAKGRLYLLRVDEDLMGTDLIYHTLCACVGDVLGTQAAIASDGSSLITANGVDLVAGNAVGLLAGHSRDLAAVGFVHGTLHGFSLVTAHGVRHVTGCGVHQGLSRIGDGSISCAVGDITGRGVLDIFGIGCYGLIRCRVRDAAFRPSGEDVVSKCGLHVGGIDENFVGTDLICHAGRACVGDGSSVICEDLARCHVGNTGVIHHALHCRTVADLRRHRLTGRAGDGLCLIRHRFSSLIGNRPGIIRDGAIRSEVADIAIRGRIGDTLCSRIRQVLSCIGNRTICRHVGNVAICRSIGDVIRGCIGNCVAGRVDELVGIVLDGAVLGRIRQIRRGLRRRRGVFAVLDLAGDGIRFLIELRILRVTRVDLVENLADVLLEGRTQALFVGEDTAAFRGTLRCSVLVVIRIDSGGRDAISLYRQIALLPAIVCSRRFCPSGRAVCIVIKRTFLLAAVFGVRGFLIACDFTSCDSRAGRDVVVANDAILRQVDFINVEFALDRQIAADFCIAFCHQFAANLSIARCLQRSCLHSTSRLDGAAACIEAINRCGSGFQCSLDFRIAIYRCISGGMKSSRFHRSSGFDSTCTGINPYSDYISTCIHCEFISSRSQCTCAELSTNRSIIGNSQGIAFQIPFCFNTTSRFNISGCHLVRYIQTARRNRT